MKPGREMDRLVAEKVYGLDVHSDGENTVALYKGCKMIDRLLSYSTSDVVALRMLGERDWYEIEYEKVNPKHMLFNVQVIGKLGGDIWCSYGQTLAHAACLAVLRAVGVEVSDE